MHHPLLYVTLLCDSLKLECSMVDQKTRKLKPFVADRVGSIQLKTELKQWRYIPTKINVAGLLTRRTIVKDLDNNKTWWHRLSFLNSLNEKWPPLDHIEMTKDALSEVKKKLHLQVLC